MSIRLQVKEIMQEKNITIVELAYRADVSISTVQNLRTNKTTRIDLPIMQRIAATLGVSFKDLFAEEPDPDAHITPPAKAA